MSKVDRLKERISYFIDNVASDNIILNLPARAIAGFKIDNVVDVIQNVLGDKFNKQYKCSKYEPNDNGYTFNLHVVI